jgi:Transposase zinc-ribbon domain
MPPSIPIQRAPGSPVPGADYPRDWDEFLAFFPDEDACLGYLERLSWPDGFVCGRCGAGGEPWRGSRRRLVCRSCGHGGTVTAGTLFQGTRTPMPVWFQAAWRVSTAEEGVSARRLQRDLGLGSYETAWAILHRLRRAMVRSGRPRLEGVVQVGRNFVPAGADRAVIAVAVEDRGDEAGRVRMRRLASARDAQLQRFVTWAVEPGATVVSDPVTGAGLPGGSPLAHLRAVQRSLGDWLLRTHQGATTLDQLDWYLDEFTFRFNRRSALHRGLLFYRLLEEALVTPPQPLGAMAAPAQASRPTRATRGTRATRSARAARPAAAGTGRQPHGGDPAAV